ncbi:hypothetical protein [Hyphomicrobium sp. NDB2Meth4]|uniref:hypothetical protein n=1 Tax=Hyphomicrobium sp. NDB2Meth4 TaxID=1892846 RepID=UPI000931CCA1|nr:hypothetical protein [Hyphomicrobium sp. NDB2Meth4]
MTERKPRQPDARETLGEGAPPRKRKESTTAVEKARPTRGNEEADARMIERKRDARIRDGL